MTEDAYTIDSPGQQSGHVISTRKQDEVGSSSKGSTKEPAVADGSCSTSSDGCTSGSSEILDVTSEDGMQSPAESDYVAKRRKKVTR